MRALHITAAATAAFAMALGGCTVGGPAGSPPDPATVTLFHIDGGPELDPSVGWFVDRVAELSDGALIVEVTHGCCGEDVDVEEDLIAAVADGDADLGWVGTRVLGDLGVTDLAAMTAPMFVDEYELQQEAAVSDEAMQALGALDELGVVGLAVMPGSLRVPLSSDAPVLTLGDWQGRTVASFHSTAAATGLEELGAVPLDVSFTERDEGLADGSISTLENSLVMLDLDREKIVPYATTNLVLWPRSSVLIADPTLSDRLSERQLALIERAARDVVDRTGELAVLDEAAIVSACEAGARFAEASWTALEEMRDALGASHGDLMKDQAAAPLYDAIFELKRQRGKISTPDIPGGCTGAAPVADPAAESGAGDAVALTGTSRRRN
jgi:TRAP-type C4-dicarboxylate transport system substrate-binding protein